jgi:transcriptional regulator with XRE-family HTH domain
LNEFPDRLRRLRESMRPLRSMTVTSQLMGLSPDALRKYERGEVEPKMTALKLIAAYYHISLDELCKMEED